MLADGQFLLSSAVSISYYYRVFAFACITTVESEPLAVGRKANTAYISQQLPRRATQNRNLIEHSGRTTSFGTKIVNVVSIGRESRLSEGHIRTLGRYDLYVARCSNMPDPETG